MKNNIAHTVGGYSERHPPYGHEPVPEETGSRVWGFVRYGAMRKGRERSAEKATSVYVSRGILVSPMAPSTYVKTWWEDFSHI